MEKFFIITDECRYKEDYKNYRKNTKDVNEVVKEFFNENEIETSKYYLTNNQLYIVPTNKDLEKFDKDLNKPIEYGLRAFKKKGKINKLFIQKLESKGLSILNKPNLWMYMSGFYGSMSTTTYLINDVMYLRLSTNYDVEINEKGFDEIKASEYYLAIESN